MCITYTDVILYKLAAKFTDLLWTSLFLLEVQPFWWRCGGYHSFTYHPAVNEVSNEVQRRSVSSRCFFQTKEWFSPYESTREWTTYRIKISQHHIYTYLICRGSHALVQEFQKQSILHTPWEFESTYPWGAYIFQQSRFHDWGWDLYIYYHIV